MKQFILFPALFSLMFSAPLFAGDATVQPDDINEKTNFYSELLHGEWAGSFNDQTIFYQFGTGGEGALIAQKTTGAMHVVRFDWAIEWQDNRWMLLFEEKLSHTKFGYEIQRLTEKQLLAIDANGNHLALNTDAPLFSTERIDRNLDLANATWQAQYNSDHTGEAAHWVTVALRLNDDETFVRSFDNGLCTVVEQGKWKLSCDGNFLFFRAEGSGDVHVARVIREGEGELMLMEALEAPVKPLHFNTSLVKLAYGKVEAPAPTR